MGVNAPNLSTGIYLVHSRAVCRRGRLGANGSDILDSIQGDAWTMRVPRAAGVRNQVRDRLHGAANAEARRGEGTAAASRFGGAAAADGAFAGHTPS